MAHNGNIYANTTANALSVKLITSDKLTRLLDAKNGNLALKVLLEYGFGEGTVVTDPYKFEELCEAEQATLYSLIKDVCGDEVVSKCLTIQNDYHNLKCAIKKKYGKAVVFEDIAIPYTSLPGAELLELVLADSYSSLPTFFVEALKIADGMHIAKTLSASKIDVICDKAMFKDIFATLGNKNNSLLLDYFKRLADIKNISIAVRSKKFGSSYAELSDRLLEGGDVLFSVFEKYIDGSDEVLVEGLSITPYKELAKVIISNESNAITRFECMADNLLLNMYKDKKFMPAEMLIPFVGYVFARLQVIKNVRLIMVCKNNSLDIDQIKERLRDIYG